MRLASALNAAGGAGVDVGDAAGGAGVDIGDASGGGSLSGRAVAAAGAGAGGGDAKAAGISHGAADISHVANHHSASCESATGSGVKTGTCRVHMVAKGQHLLFGMAVAEESERRFAAAFDDVYEFLNAV